MCINGQCVYSPECFTDDDCDSGYVCERGSCVPEDSEPTGPPQPTVPPQPSLPPAVSGQARPRYTPAQQYPFPCNLTAPGGSVPYGDVEFHSLRPYQESPCNPNYEDLALFCGNNFLVADTVVIEKRWYPDYGIPKPGPIFFRHDYYYEGEPIEPGGYCEMDSECPTSPISAVCVANRCVPAVCQDNGDGTETCRFVVDRSKDIAIDLEGAYLPIMGFTEPSVGSETRPDRVTNAYSQDENMDDARKVNEYVSWYLNGINNRAEYAPPDPDTEEGRRRIIDFSGPLKKLLASDSQALIRENEKDRAGGERHNQIVGCSLAGIRVPCYPSIATRVRLTSAGGNLFSYVPLSSTEDRVGIVTLASYFIHPALSSQVNIIKSFLTNLSPADLFFAHMQESVELARHLQETFTPKEGPIDRGALPSTVPTGTGGFCDILDVRSNPGDNLFPGEVSATINYTADITCNFIIEGEGRLCDYFGGGASCQVVPDDYYCDTNYHYFDCTTGDCAENCQPLPDTECYFGYSCVPDSWGCDDVIPDPSFYGFDNCDGGFQCGTGCNVNYDPLPRLVQECRNNFNIAINTVTETPLANEVWARLVAGPAGVFRRIFPKIEEGARPIEGLWDIPAATSVLYTVSGGTATAGNPAGGRTAGQAELYFPHIGGVHEYFLKCIQKTLRPKGYADAGCESGPPVKIATCGETFANFNPPTSTTPRAEDYFRNYIQANLTEEVIQVYAQAEAQTGVPCEVLAGIHFIEGNNNPNQSLISGRPIGSPEPDAGGAVFATLLETAIYAAEHLQGKVGGDLNNSWETLITALSRYNGGGNSNCRWPTNYAGCPPYFEGEDDPYPMNWLDGRHAIMYLIYCADHTVCGPPFNEFLRPGVLAVAVQYMLNMTQ